MNSSLESHIDQVASDVRDIKHALLGNPLLNDGGLVGRVANVEDGLKTVTTTQSNWKSFAAGMAFIFGTIATLFGWFIGAVLNKS